MSKIKSYISSFRLRTLPLALSSILMGNFIAAYHHSYSWAVGILATVTTVLLQILSNVANDYGDAVSGADNVERIGPARMVASGKISLSEMKRTVIVFSALSLISGIALIAVGNLELLSLKAWGLLVLGFAAIAAAIKYTVGKNPYGYSGRGDIFVFLFFGLAGVLGTYFLHTGTIDPWLLLPASAVGLLSTGVLNLNNLRDIESDAKSGKHTLVVKNGSPWGKRYQTVLLVSALLFMVTYGLFQFVTLWQWLFLLAVPLIAKNLWVVFNNNEPYLLYPQLKKLAMTTFIMVLLFGVGLMI
ncbi:1,4-dihydroxy-2-naphthoate prenyltransferase [Saccharicrinis carchari]|uniref:1,4-dihydroxy-2-naphthoate octaprenyltransferase n=1 Tax=Saccharicrinis carchari TaxID=1168039 RepID=A0A521ERF5_SACCC|nr:1,4-dihydroxy-2-naphthoate polyprenyltransferase [Saccharicrinis carchari]SMO85680.1 1,4-dihydroxy-2-naphthoate prenyltransferase [Saccharicrinis carchari]